MQSLSDMINLLSVYMTGQPAAMGQVINNCEMQACDLLSRQQLIKIQEVLAVSQWRALCINQQNAPSFLHQYTVTVSPPRPAVCLALMRIP